MTPDIGTRLHTVVTALQQVIMPAIPPTEVLAVEQAALAVSQLTVLAEQYRYLGEYEALCLNEMTALGAALVDAADGGPSTTDAARALRSALASDAPNVASSPVTTSAAHAHRNTIARAIDVLLLASAVDGTEEFRDRSGRIVIDHGIRQSGRDRAWFRACGMDPDAASLPTIPQMIKVVP